jgi:hypothetical protein
MKIEKGSGADKFWTGIIGIFLLLEIGYLIRCIPYLNSVGVFNFTDSTYLGNYILAVVVSILYILVVISIPSLGDNDDSNMDHPNIDIILFITLTLPCLLILLPIAIIVFLVVMLYKAITAGFSLLFQTINDWANERF